MDLKLNNDLKYNEYASRIKWIWLLSNWNLSKCKEEELTGDRLFSFHNYDMNDYLFHFLIILVLNKKSIAWLSFYLLKSNKWLNYPH